MEVRYPLTDLMYIPVADPDFELRRGPGSVLVSQPAPLPSIISSFFIQNKGEARALPLNPPLHTFDFVYSRGPPFPNTPIILSNGTNNIIYRAQNSNITSVGVSTRSLSEASVST